MTMERDLWQRARPLFDEIVDLGPDARLARLEAIGRSEPAMRDVLVRLLQGDDHADAVLQGYDFAPGSQDASSPPVELDPLGIVGRTVSHFSVTEFVAAGGMGVVYKAADVTLGRIVAIKFPLPHQRMEDETKERFIHEARSIAALDHPNLCTVYEFGESAHGLYLAMPFYQGETLKERISRERVLPVGDAVGIVRQVAAGLSSAHAAGIVHRDLKPANVMLLPGGSVKILDFGIAKVRDVQLTRSGVALGTVAYMAPGQAVGEQADAQADLWAIGVMLYEMLTGVLPFRGPNEMAVLHAIMQVNPDPPSHLNKDVPPALDTVVAGLLQKNPSDRYRSAATLLTDLDAAIAGGPVVQKPPVETRRAVPVLRRIGLPAMAALAALAVAAAAWFGRGLVRGRSDGDASTASVAVLPFVDGEGDKATLYIASGFAEELNGLLGRAGVSRVVAQTSVAALQRRGVSVDTLAKQLGATHVVSGTLRMASDTFYLGVSFTRMPGNVPVWSGNIKAPVAQLVALERQVADSVLRALQSRARVVSSAPQTTDPIAYDLYLKARLLWRERTREPLEKALEYYQEALARDPQFAAAYSGIAQVYVNMSNFGFYAHREALNRADVASATAVALDSTLPDAFAARGMVLMSRGSYPEAEASLRHAIQLNQNLAWAHHYYALLLQMTGRVADSKQETRRTLALDPLSIPAAAHLGALLASQDSLLKARDQLQHVLQMQPNFAVALQYLGAVEAALGNYAAAEKLFARELADSSSFSGVVGALAYTYARTGRAAQASRVMTDARAAVTDERSRVDYALALAIMGQADSAFAMLGSAEWDIPTLNELRSDPLLRPFRSDPRYPQLLARWGLKPAE
jgi:TolB-like protein/tetratricopeptide (TPR) repeat protein